MLVTVFIVALFAFAALSIDVANVFHHQRNEQAATDAGAFAGAALLVTNPPASDDAVIQEAEKIAVANNVTVTEIKASNAGTIQVGHWDHTNFVANATPRNALRVPAKRNVPLMFGKVIGMDAMNPATYSIGARDPLGCITNVIPFGVSIQQIAGKQTGDTMSLNDSAITSGNQGEINLEDYKNPAAWDADMINLGCGASCLICAGEYPVITGNAHVAKDFDAIDGSKFIMPIVDETGFTGSGMAKIIGFVYVHLDWSKLSGANWTAQVTFLSQPTSGTGGGSCEEEVCLKTRALVQ